MTTESKNKNYIAPDSIWVCVLLKNNKETKRIFLSRLKNQETDLFNLIIKDRPCKFKKNKFKKQNKPNMQLSMPRGWEILSPK